MPYDTQEEVEVRGDQFQDLNEEEQEVVKRHHNEFTCARDTRDNKHDEFDQMSVTEYVEFNAKTGQTFIEPRKNATDINIVTGIPREKMLTVASNILKLNLETDVLAFNDSNDEDIHLGRAFTFMLAKSKEMEGSEVKDLLRIMYLLEQGTIFLEEAWVPYTKMRKFIKDKALLDPGTGFEGLSWVPRELTTYQCESKIIDMTSVYLGDMKQFDINKQPYLFTREVMHIDLARAIYGTFPSWKYVKPGDRSKFGDHGEDDTPYRDFRLYPLREKQVEVIKYQNIWTDEYQIYINGVMMLPPDFPLPWEWTADGDEGKCYSISKTVLEPISPYFPYGKSMMSKVRVHAELLDELMRQFVRKTKQSTNPPVGNMTGSTLSPRLFDPGIIWDNVDPRKIQKLIEHNGVNGSEYQMYQMVKENVDQLTVSPTYQGQQEGKQMTATQTVTLQRQAQLAMTLVLFSMRLMNEKADYLRVQNILENWTKPIARELIDEVNGIFQNKYREVSYENAQLQDKVGTAKIKFVDHAPTKEQRREISYNLLTDERKNKSDKQTIFLSLPLLRKFKFTWKTKANPSERETSDLKKILFGEELGQLMQFFGPQAPNMDYYKKQFAQTWGRKFEEAFTPSSMSDLQTLMGQRDGSGGVQTGSRTPNQGGVSQRVAQGMQKAINPSGAQMMASA